MALMELAFDLALHILSSQGGFLIKGFQGEGFDQFLLEIKKQFKRVVIRKPDASRGRSREVYILARR
jgi:23S rRNA (uridine2552-2'-O)-methyltransferase